MVAGPLLAVDTPSMLYRAFFALPKTITDDKGQSINALLGTANLILREIEEHSPRAVVLCFGQEAGHYRTELYPPYHADRPEMPEQLVPQWAAAPKLFARFGWAIAQIPGPGGGRPARHAGEAGGRGGRQGADHDGRP